MPALFAFKSTFNASIAIGDKTLPFHVKRLSRAELEAFQTDYERLAIVPRGSAPAPAADAPLDPSAIKAAEDARVAAWTKDTEAERVAFYEHVIRDYITLDAGLVSVCDKDVTDGAGLFEAFISRKDVHFALVQAILTSNRLDDLFVKNLPSPRASDGSSGASIPSRGGDAQGSTAASAEPSGTAATGDATEERPVAADGAIPKIH